MDEAAKILLEILTLGRSAGALRARAALAEDHAVRLARKAKNTTGAKRNRILRRAAFWTLRAETLLERASYVDSAR